MFLGKLFKYPKKITQDMIEQYQGAGRTFLLFRITPE